MRYQQDKREASYVVSAVTGSTVCEVQGRLPEREAQVTR